MSFPLAQRMWRLVQQALRETVQLRLAWILGLAALVLVAGASVLREFNFGAEELRFLRDYTEAILALGGTVIAIMLNAALVQGGVERRSLVMALIRGVRRHEWLLSRWVAVSVALAWLVLLGHALLAALLVRYGHAVSVADLAVGAGRMLLRLLIVSSFALTACVVTRGLLLACTLALGLTLAAQLASIFEWAGRHAEASGRVFWRVLQWLVPDFASLDAGMNAAHVLGYATGYAILYALLACVIFSRREL